MKRITILRLAVICLMCCLIFSACGNTPSSDSGQPAGTSEAKKELLVSAAASLKNPMTEIEKMFEDKNKTVDLIFNFGSSGSLQKQIEEGAPADIFLSAGSSQMDALEKKNLIAEGTRKNFIGNELVLVTLLDNQNISSFQDLVKAEQIAIGTPETVPAGKYAKETLQNMKLWDDLQDKFVQAKDVTQVLTYVASGNVDAGIVYGSDAKSSDKVKVAAAAPADSHSPIIYPGAVISSSKNPGEAKEFLDYLVTPDAQAIYQKYGFSPVQSSGQ